MQDAYEELPVDTQHRCFKHDIPATFVVKSPKAYNGLSLLYVCHQCFTDLQNNANGTCEHCLTPNVPVKPGLIPGDNGEPVTGEICEACRVELYTPPEPEMSDEEWEAKMERDNMDDDLIDDDSFDGDDSGDGVH